MTDLCKYKYFFGKPGEGAHSYRLFGVAIIDVLLTILIAFIITYFTGYKLIYTLIFMFLLGIVSHRMFCVRTTVDKILFNE